MVPGIRNNHGLILKSFNVDHIHHLEMDADGEDREEDTTVRLRR